jgi:hypothetical protein
LAVVQTHGMITYVAYTTCSNAVKKGYQKESGIMEKALILKSLHIFMALWGIALLFLFFRPKIDFFWKFIALLLFSFYLFIFYDEVKAGYQSFIGHWDVELVIFLKEFLKIIFITLFLLWPVTLVIIFYRADDMGAEQLLKFMCVLTLLVWMIFILIIMFNKGYDVFFYEKLREIFRFEK